MLAANQSNDSASGDDEPAAPAAKSDDEDATGADDIAAMLAANQSHTAEPSAASGPDEGSADDIAAMLAASQAEAEAAPSAEAVPEVVPDVPSVAVDVDISEEEITRPGIEAADFAHLRALSDENPESPAAQPANARLAADLAVPAPEEVTSDDVANDDIAAMLAANRAQEG
jgi:hypothetical protein